MLADIAVQPRLFTWFIHMSRSTAAPACRTWLSWVSQGLRSLGSLQPRSPGPAFAGQCFSPRRM